MGLRWDTSDLKLKSFEEHMDAAIAVYANTQAERLIGYAKENRPWTDRTGAARQRLNAYVTDIPSEEKRQGYRINLAHGVDYGVWLELAMEKRYAILFPTVELKGNEVIAGMKNLVRKIK